MELIFWGICLVIFIALVSGNTKTKKNKDDFAGSTIASYFLLEEFVDKPYSRHHESSPDTSFIEEEEADWFEDEFE